MLRAAQGCEDVARAAMAEIVRAADPAQLGLGDIERDLAAYDALAGHVADESVQHACAARGHRECTDGHLATALERGEKCALGRRVDHRRAIAERSEERARRVVVPTNLNRDRTLPRRRKPLWRVEVCGDALRD